MSDKNDSSKERRRFKWRATWRETVDGKRVQKKPVFLTYEEAVAARKEAERLQPEWFYAF